jgi:hypothetical protein
MRRALRLDSPDQEGYNAFAPSLLLKLPADSKIYLAREGSVCVYVETKANIRNRKALKADNFWREKNGQYGIWWD